MRRRRLLLFGLLMIGSLPIGPLQGASAASGSDTERVSAAAISSSGYGPDAEECLFLSIVNDYRARHGRSKLTLDRRLGAAAEHHSVDMATRNYWHDDHSLADGTAWTKNLTNHNYDFQALATSVGENIAAGNATADATFDQWRASSGHNANMLSSNMRAIGIGRANDADSTFGWYWTTTFGGKAVDPVSCSGPSAASTDGAPFPIARGGRTSSSTASTYAFDGDAGTNWRTTKSTPPTSAWVYFDLGGVKAIGSIEWLFSKSGSADSYKIQVSTDRTTWTTIATKSNPSANRWQSLDWSGSARYVRFIFSNPNRDAVLGYLSEVQIAG